MATTFKPKNILIPTISVLILSACGGGGGLDLSEVGTFTGPGNKELDPNTQHAQPVGIFLVNEIEGEKTTLSDMGQQNSPAVAIVDVDGTKTLGGGDVVRFNQVAFLSAACLFEQCPGAEQYKKAAEQQKTRLETELSAQQAILKELQDKKQDTSAQIALINATQQKIAKIDAISAREGTYSFLDTDGSLAEGFNRYTIDDSNTAGKKLINDAGVSKIDAERINGRLYYSGGSIDRHFNGVVSLGSETGERMVYYRDPSSAGGWGFQTFFRYYSTPQRNILEKRRDLLQGYQSIGYPTQKMPKNGIATYQGISHALYGGEQVTMLNEINADFANRNLDYNTTETAILHTFEQGEHIIEKRPDLNVSGSASWAKGKPGFVGNVTSQSGLKGTLEGQFYGPQANEVGGVFGMTGEVNGKTVQYIGGFGAKR